MKLAVLTDGASHNNGGLCGIGVVILNADTKEVLAQVSEAIGNGTNTHAEYTAFTRGIERTAALIQAQDQKPGQVILLADSNLVVSQMKGEWKVSASIGHLYDLASIALSNLKALCPDVVIDHIPREYNHQADELSRQAVEKALHADVQTKYPFLSK